MAFINKKNCATTFCRRFIIDNCYTFYKKKYSVFFFILQMTSSMAMFAVVVPKTTVLADLIATWYVHSIVFEIEYISIRH